MKLCVLKNFSLSSTRFNLLLSIGLVVFYNKKLWLLLTDNILQNPLNEVLFILSFFIFLIALFNLVLTIISIKILQKPISVGIILSATIATYFMNSFGIVYDKEMIQNALETDSKEALDLFSSTLIIYIVLLGAIPSVLIMQSKIVYASFWVESRKRIVICLLCIITIAVNIAVFYKDYSSTFRNHREIRNLIIPSSYLYYTAQYFSGAYQQKDTEFTTIAEDAVLKSKLNNSKKVVTILVVGETARAMNFSVNGYSRPTNPKLSKRNIINFTNVNACGTSTSVSVPCIFSKYSRKNFDTWQAKNTENILDVMSRVGFDVLWRDNNSGCKGVCDRINKQSPDQFYSSEFCDDTNCFDEVLLENLDSYLQKNNKPSLIVLHQEGSHGPAYYKRSPKAFKQFSPTCKTTDLTHCEQQSIINSYDNSLLYTDHFLAKTIDYLSSKDDQYDTAMIYISDHGESLGENNTYLHGLPYPIAPETQTHVPFLAWFSNSFQERFSLNTHCLKNKQNKPFSHDNIFHSLLGLFSIATHEYQRKYDIFSSCRPANQLTAN